MKLIGINGFKQSGKGTTALILRENHLGIVYEVGFADKLKVLAAKTLGYSDRDPRKLIALMDEFKLDGMVERFIFDNTESEGTITGRQYLQNLGNEARQVFGDDFWIDQVLPRPSLHYANWREDNEAALEARFPEIDVVAITDLRYENEAHRVKSLGGVVWEVVRPGVESDGHASEQPLHRDLVDWQIVNDGDLHDLSDRVYEAMEATL